jgi:hypothetical protein
LFTKKFLQTIAKHVGVVILTLVLKRILQEIDGNQANDDGNLQV